MVRHASIHLSSRQIVNADCCWCRAPQAWRIQHYARWSSLCLWEACEFPNPDVAEPFQAGWQEFYYDGLLLCNSPWFVCWMFSERSPGGWSSAQAQLLLHPCNPVLAILPSAPCSADCLHWSRLLALKPPGQLHVSVECVVPSALHSALRGLLLQLCCWPHQLPRGSGCSIIQDLECLFGVSAICFLSTHGHLLTIMPISTSPSVYPRNARIFTCPSFLEGSPLIESLELMPRVN